MTIKIYAVIEANIDESELAGAMMQHACSLAGNPDDAGCDWFTDNHGKTYIDGAPGWRVSCDPKVAALVDAYHLLKGHRLADFKLADEQIAARATE